MTVYGALIFIEFNMSKLDFYRRPLVEFNPNVKEHREYYYEFLSTNTWGRCPVRFICPSEPGSEVLISGVIMRQLLQFYSGKEFDNKIKIKKNSRKNNTTSKSKSVAMSKKLPVVADEV